MVSSAPESRRKVRLTPFTFNGIKTKLLINLKGMVNFLSLPSV
jgi:hypothetical protein